MNTANINSQTESDWSIATGGRSSSIRMPLLEPSTESLRFLVIDGVPRFNLKRVQLEEVFSSPRLVQRLKACRWIEPLDATSTDPLYPVARVLQAQLRMESGEMPPLLPSERNRRLGGGK